MAYNAKGQTYDFNEKQVVNGMFEAIIMTREVAAGQGIIDIGTLLAENSAGLVVAYDDALSDTLGTGDGTTTDFSGTLANAPVQPGSVAVVVDTATYNDDGNGNIWDGTAIIGHINYSTGDISLTFATAPASGVNVVVNYANKLVGVAADKTDESLGELAAAVVRKGVVVADMLVKANGNPVNSADMMYLENNGIFAY